MMDPIHRFSLLFERAHRSGDPEPTAMALATVDPDGRPSVRMVLLKDFDAAGFVFFTNLESRKARALTATGSAAICFHWQPLQAQVRVEGSVRPVSEAEADEYFASRPRGSQIGAWASLQSRPLPDFTELEARVIEIEKRFEGGPVPRPAYWSGFRLVPDRMEFWSGRQDRLHERELYTRGSEDDPWSSGLLFP